ncbi:MAG: mannose-1-phosphate guanylyltransferase [Chitinophagales bacterium]|nr:mannose-1-phosphate guanylyltransferase [Chitinophagales bacterium]
MLHSENNFVVIMAGGVGSRFWPMSRNNRPKQFLDVLASGKTLLQLTYERFLKICNPENIFIVSNEQYKGLIAEQLGDVPESQFLFEPSRKNTAPCIAYACHFIAKKNPKANIVIAASDHYIVREKVFLEVVEKALTHVATHNHLVTLGIHPTRPDTGYGYIQFIDEKNDQGIYKVKTFTEKPNFELAVQFINSGEFLWNSGMFVWNVNTIINAIHQHMPDIFEAFKGYEKVIGTKDESKFLDKAYSICPNTSIDFGVMEKASNVRVIPSNFGWSDVGTWKSLYSLREHDYHGNAVNGKQVMLYDATNNMIHVPDEKLVVIQGLEDYVVIDTPDVLLICAKDQEQKIKDFTIDIKRNKGERFL